MALSLLQLLTESLTLCSCYVILKVDKTMNRTEIFNRIRALPGVIIVDPVTSQLVGRHVTDKNAYSLVELKYIVNTNPLVDLDIIKKKIVTGDEHSKSIEGVSAVIIQKKTLKRIDD